MQNQHDKNVMLDANLRANMTHEEQVEHLEALIRRVRDQWQDDFREYQRRSSAQEEEITRLHDRIEAEQHDRNYAWSLVPDARQREEIQKRTSWTTYQPKGGTAIVAECTFRGEHFQAEQVISKERLESVNSASWEIRDASRRLSAGIQASACKALGIRTEEEESAPLDFIRSTIEEILQAEQSLPTLSPGLTEALQQMQDAAKSVPPAPAAVPEAGILIEIAAQLLDGRWASECVEDWPGKTGPEFAAKRAEVDQERRRKMAVSLRSFWDSLAAPAPAEPTIKKVSELPKGARFSYPEAPESVYVLLENYRTGLCAAWHGPDDSRRQSLCSVAETDEEFQQMEVILREPAPAEPCTEHSRPEDDAQVGKTLFEEQYQLQRLNPAIELLKALREARPLVLHGEGWIEEINSVLAAFYADLAIDVEQAIKAEDAPAPTDKPDPQRCHHHEKGDSHQ